MNYSIIPSARTVVHHCKARGIKNIIISPGSRNAPLTLGFTADPYFSCYSIVDERSAAFFALGMAQQSMEPVAVVCTSGSALLNYYPAVAEAFYSDIPLVVISADRPGYKVDIGDGQTIRQDHVFQRHILYTALLKQDVLHATDAIRDSGTELPQNEAALVALQYDIQIHNETELNKAMGQASMILGPVHINVPFEEPLYAVQEVPGTESEVGPLPSAERYLPEPLGDFAGIWNNAARKMVLIGAARPGILDEQYVKLLAADPSVLVFTETTSNCHHPNFFPSIDSIIAPIEMAEDPQHWFKDLQPDLLLTLGGMVVSKKIKAFLRQYRPEHHWHVGPKKGYDTYYSLTHHFKCDPNAFFHTFIPRISVLESDYQQRWLAIRERYRLRRESYLQEIAFSDLCAFAKVLREIPNGYQVQLANSSTVRYAQLFEMHPSLEVYCNRGTSGIDGSTSTAIGASLMVANPTVLITGDLSLIYDSNGLWNNYIRPDFRIIVINNQGGGIFRILPGQEDTDRFATYFETVQDMDLSSLCSLFKLSHHKAHNEEELADVLATFFKPSDTAKLLEIQTPRLLNNKILLAYFEYLS